MEQPLATSAATSATAASTTFTATPATIAVAPPEIIVKATISETSSVTTSQQPPKLSPPHGSMRTGLNSFYDIYCLYSMYNNIYAYYTFLIVRRKFQPAFNSGLRSALDWEA